eukprot:CAMPEP_0175984854 /NCGR_PEP_ID=MMETSP0108-20121206/49232_1 /TAXON_ID=195067 ORGANISM="Goniomonas pacifica, Strain CCMP1869" /NCGR_SAMPLE_ID=MMETSP0108 /ASSEMBLY_ACC=CAM_ASM_000204 /LENGTH=108 /DNA_ID=CAMNT_0017315761 /DNA_START=190 /DNA_END=516 /DNA_ORIENTATION=-
MAWVPRLLLKSVSSTFRSRVARASPVSPSTPTVARILSERSGVSRGDVHLSCNSIFGASPDRKNRVTGSAYVSRDYSQFPVACGAAAKERTGTSTVEAREEPRHKGQG